MADGLGEHSEDIATIAQRPCKQRENGANFACRRMVGEARPAVKGGISVVIKPDGAPVTGIFTTDNMDMKDWLPAMLHRTARQLLGPQGRDLTFLEDKGN